MNKLYSREGLFCMYLFFFLSFLLMPTIINANSSNFKESKIEKTATETKDFSNCALIKVTNNTSCTLEITGEWNGDLGIFYRGTVGPNSYTWVDDKYSIYEERILLNIMEKY